MRKMMICSHDHCYGCAACKQICPKNAISMIPDKMGFLYPKIEEKNCIQCRLCLKICPANQVPSFVHLPQTAFALKNRDEKMRRISQSGGACLLLGKCVIEKGGVVYGAAMNGDEVRHIRIVSTDELPRIAGSKYVQSNTEEIWRDVALDLQKEKRTVLFFGTPCQCSAAKALFARARNLLTVDIICHGVPGPRIWKDYVKHVTRTEHAQVISYQFRDLQEPWGITSERIELSDGNVLKRKDYLDLFYSNAIARLSCSTCPYARIERVGDVTAGDYWGIEESHPDFADDLGVSAVLVNTGKGFTLFQQILNDAEVIKTSYEDIRKVNVPLNRPAGLSRQRWIYELIYGLFGISGMLIYRHLSKTIKRAVKGAENNEHE